MPGVRKKRIGFNTKPSAALRRAVEFVHKRQTQQLFGTTVIQITPQHLTLNEMVSLGLITISELYESFSCFTVVRHPYARVLSQWRSYHERYPTVTYDDPNDFIEKWLFNPSVRKNHGEIAHSRPQTCFLSLDEYYKKFHGREPAIAIIKFEQLNTEWPHLARKHGLCQYDLPWIRKSGQYSPDDYNMLSRKARSLITRYYRRDFAEFGYNA